MKKRTKIILSVVSGLTAAALIALNVVLAVGLYNVNSEFEKRKAMDGATIAALQSDIASCENKLDDAAKTEKELESEIAELESSLSDMEGYFAEHYSEMIAENNERISELGELRADIEKMVDRLKDKKAIDVTALSALVTELEDHIEKGSPLVKVMRTEEEIAELEKEEAELKMAITEHKWVNADKYIEEGKQALGEGYSDALTLSKVLESTEAKAPKIAVYYEDLVSGYKYSYNGDAIFDSASVVKAPYIVGILKAMSQYEDETLEISEKDAEKYSKEVLDEMFDFDAEIVLDHETMDKPGSGELVKADDGTLFTYRELIKLSLEKSDNTAFALVREHFTNKWYFDFAKEAGARSPLSNYMSMSVNEAGAMFKEMYYFTLENDKYGALVKESMEKASHTVLSKTALADSDVAHKYGWDVNAYHDAAIVYGERPYIAIVFTDIDSGGATADNYIRQIFKKIEKIHNFFE